ncbi:uncharacterized protein LOC143631108 [Bidens hawaiensis]|uniref:uncharacterized protein LOC143631108 n=1 Tax=Bidens hawaiensis TaxID=980011 RepID=UPI0040495FF1
MYVWLLMIQIMETAEFVNQTKRMFQDSVNHGMFEHPYITGDGYGSAEPTCSSACPTPSIVLDHNQSDNWLQPNTLSFQESWNSFPNRSNDQDLFDPLQEFVIPDDLDISQWIQEPISMNLEQNGGNLIPTVKESPVDFHHQKSNKQVGIDSSTPYSAKGLFSKLRIDELLEGISGTSHAVSSTAKNHVESPKATKKKAKSGTRPRPKDRQQILDRMAELRELIPNGNKMSIDSLLDRTVKHMVFLQSVTKHAARIKQADEPKVSTYIYNRERVKPVNGLKVA